MRRASEIAMARPIPMLAPVTNAQLARSDVVVVVVVVDAAAVDAVAVAVAAMERERCTFS